ncbi:MAG: hypothetical protein IT452_02960 [Planctomycetia bacterium]|nr:hypothetical protein [Planctomycetia bacterium]
MFPLCGWRRFQRHEFPLLCPRCGSEVKVVAVIAAPEESRALPAPAAASHAASPPPSQATPTLCESPTLPGLLDAIPRDLFLWPERAKRIEGSDAPAWDSPDPPGPDHALHPDSHPGHDEDDRDDGPDPDSENIAQDRLELALPATAPPVSPRAGKRASQPLIRARGEA